MIRELRSFITVVKCGSFAAAGASLGLTQSAVSSQIQRLEDALGQKLFDRTKRSARLNPAGERAFAQAQVLVAQFSRLASDGEYSEGDVVIRLGAISSVQVGALPKAIKQVSLEYPKLRVRLIPGGSLALMELLGAGELDAAIVVKPPSEMLTDVLWQKLARHPYVLLAPKRTMGNWRTMLESSPFLRYDRRALGGRQIDRFLRAQRLTIREFVEVDDIVALAAMVEEGLGVALAPLAGLDLGRLRGVKAITLGKYTFYREIGIATRRGEPIRAIKDIAKALQSFTDPDGSDSAEH